MLQFVKAILVAPQFAHTLIPLYNVVPSHLLRPLPPRRIKSLAAPNLGFRAAKLQEKIRVKQSPHYAPNLFADLRAPEAGSVGVEDTNEVGKVDGEGC